MNKMLSNRFKHYCYIYEMNISDIHKRTGISRSTLTQIKKGELKQIQFKTIESLAELFQVSPSDMFKPLVIRYE